MDIREVKSNIKTISVQKEGTVYYMNDITKPHDFFEFIENLQKSKKIDTLYTLDNKTKNNQNIFYWFPKLYSHAPDLNIIEILSGEKYEKTKCVASIAFFPENNIKDILPLFSESAIIFDSSNYILFEKNNIRAIRKQLQAVKEENTLAVVYIENKYSLIGIVAKASIKNTLYYYVEIRDSMKWCISLNYSNDREKFVIPLLGYYNGNYLPYNEIHTENDAILDKATLPNNNNGEIYHNFFTSSNDRNIIRNILKHILKFHHGTSLVIIHEKNDNKHIQDEVKRFTNIKRGIMLSPPIDLSQINIDNDKILFLQGMTEVDGGLIISDKGKCYAYGVIFDGIIEKKISENQVEKCEGNPARGSRYNSMKTYIFNAQDRLTNCLGIVCSDDGGIDIITPSQTYNTTTGIETTNP